MADQADVETALVALVAAALYPDGVDQPSLPGPDCRIYRGWPNAASLDADLAAGRINVTVFPLPDDTRVTTRYARQWVGVAAAPRITAAVSTNSVTVGGSADPGQLIGVLVDGHAYVYRTQRGDTPGLVAANLASQARAEWIVQLTGSTLTFVGAAHVRARVVADGPVFKEIRRQEQGFRISCWCPTPATRDASAATIDVSLAGVTFIELADGSSARLTYTGTAVFDQSQDALLYRRDLLYTAEYPTITTAQEPAMLFGEVVLNAASFIA